MNPAPNYSAFQFPSFERFPSQELGGRGLYWQQRVVGSFNPNSNTFDVDSFLKTDANPAGQKKGLEVLIAMQRGAITYKDFFHELPKVRVVDPNNAPDASQSKLADALRSLIDRRGGGVLAKEEWEMVLHKYGEKGEDIIKLMADLIVRNPKIDMKTASDVLRMVHGDLRSEAYLSLAQLNIVACGSPQQWEGVLKRLSSTPVFPSAKETQLLTLGRQERIRQRVTDGQMATDRSQKDYYQILGVSPDANDRAIRDAFHRMAKKYHPDMNKKDPTTEDKFKEINEAYQILRNEEKRAAYDSSRRPAQKSPSVTPKESSIPKENIVRKWKEASHIRGIPSDYTEIDGRPGWYINERTGDMFDSSTAAGAQTLLDALLAEEPDLAEELGLHTVGADAKKGVPPKGREEPSKGAPEQQKNQAAGEERNFTPDDIAGATDKGRKRTNNEDNFYMSADGKVFAVFDGVGGAEHGEMASGIARQVFEQRGINTDLRSLLEQVNSKIFNMSRQLGVKGRMATTGTVGMIAGNKLYLFHVGDSRAYLSYQGRKLIQLTKDHTEVQELIDAGMITPEQAKTHLKRNTLSRALGSGIAVEVDVREVDLKPGDTVILCTDGLDKVFDREGILWEVNHFAPKEAVKNFIEKGNKRGAPDNITVVIRKFKG